MLFAIEIKGGLLKDNATSVPIIFYNWFDAFKTVAMLVCKGQQAKVVTYKAVKSG